MANGHEIGNFVIMSDSTRAKVSIKPQWFCYQNMDTWTIIKIKQINSKSIITIKSHQTQKPLGDNNFETVD